MGSVNEVEMEEDVDLDEDELLVKQIDNDIKESREHLADWREVVDTCYDYYAGEQWSEKDKTTLTEQERVPITFNRIARTINAVAGLEVQNRQSVTFSPRETNDGKVAELLSAASSWVRDNCDAEDEESEMFQDTLIGGIGWIETHLDYTTDPNGCIYEDRVDVGEMDWDIHAKKRNLDDRRWNSRTKWVDKKLVKAKWPHADLDGTGELNDNTSATPHTRVTPDQYQSGKKDVGMNNKRKGLVELVQYQWWELECIYRVPDIMTGKLEEKTKEEFNKMEHIYQKIGIKGLKQEKKVYKQAFKIGKQILEKGPSPVEGFTFQCTTGLRDRNRNLWFGLVKLMIDPQMYANKWLSQILNILNSNSKGGIFYETGAFKNPQQALDDYAKPNAAIELNPGTLAQGKIQPKEMPRYPEGLDRLLQMAMQNINDIPGVNLEMLGVANRDQAGYLEMQRREAGITVLAPFFDSLRRYRKEQGRILAQFITKYISDGRLIRITGQQGAESVPLLKEKLTFEYDIVVDTAPTSPHVAEKVYMMLSQQLPILLQAGIPIPPEIIDYAPIPESLKEKWKKLIVESKENPKAEAMDKLNMQLMQLEAAKKEKEVGETESKTTLNMAKAAEAAAISQDEAAQAANKLGIAHAEQSNKNRAIEIEQQRKEREFVIDQRRKDIELALEHDRLTKKDKMMAESKATANTQ